MIIFRLVLLVLLWMWIHPPLKVQQSSRSDLLQRLIFCSDCNWVTSTLLTPVLTLISRPPPHQLPPPSLRFNLPPWPPSPVSARSCRAHFSLCVPSFFFGIGEPRQRSSSSWPHQTGLQPPETQQHVGDEGERRVCGGVSECRGVNLGSGYLSVRTRRQQGDGLQLTATTDGSDRCDAVVLSFLLNLSSGPLFAKVNRSWHLLRRAAVSKWEYPHCDMATWRSSQVVTSRCLGKYRHKQSDATTCLTQRNDLFYRYMLWSLLMSSPRQQQHWSFLCTNYLICLTFITFEC